MFYCRLDACVFLRLFFPLILGVFFAKFAMSMPKEEYLDFNGVPDGSADYVELSDSAQLDLAINAFTLAAWIHPRSWGQNDQGRIIDHGGGSSGSTGWSLHLENKSSNGSPQALRFQINNDSGFNGTASSNSISLDQWQHVAVTFDTGNLTLYVDGVVVGTSANVPVPAASTHPVRIGARNDGNREFDGKIDDVSIWGRALSAAEVASTMASELGGGENSLIAYLSMNDQAGQVAVDVSGNAHDGQLGSTAQADANDPAWAMVTNQAPVVGAGSDTTIILPDDTVSLQGSVLDDGLPGNSLLINWSLQSGPAAVQFADASSSITDVTFTAAGTYQLLLTADDGEYVSSDTVQVQVDTFPYLASISVSPTALAITDNASHQFTAAGADQVGDPFPVNPVWSATSGSIDSAGHYTATGNPGVHQITAEQNGIIGTATVLQGDGSNVWPGGSWLPFTPEALSMDSALLEQARDYALSGGGSGIVIRFGAAALSWGSQTELYDLKSSTKSIGVTALGLALQDGLVNLGDAALPHYAGFGAPPSGNTGTGWLDDISLENLATHTAGFDKSGGYIDLLYAPGTTFHYSDGGANWLADVLTALFQQDLKDLMFARVFDYLGITGSDLTWRNHAYRIETINGVKRREFGSGISANVDAMARIGYLYLRQGMWDGVQILPPSFPDTVSQVASGLSGVTINNATDFPAASNHYGLLWWNNADGTLENAPTDTYWSWGLKDSLIVIIPSLDIVAVRAGNDGWRSGWNADYAVAAPFIESIALSVQDEVSVNEVEVPLMRAWGLLSIFTLLVVIAAYGPGRAGIQEEKF